MVSIFIQKIILGVLSSNFLIFRSMRHSPTGLYRGKISSIEIDTLVVDVFIFLVDEGYVAFIC